MLHDLLYTASALDPRFKTLPFLSGHDAEMICTSITLACRAAEGAALHAKVSLKKKNITYLILSAHKNNKNI